MPRNRFSVTTTTVTPANHNRRIVGPISVTVGISDQEFLDSLLGSLLRRPQVGDIVEWVTQPELGSQWLGRIVEYDSILGTYSAETIVPLTEGMEFISGIMPSQIRISYPMAKVKASFKQSALKRSEHYVGKFAKSNIS